MKRTISVFLASLLLSTSASADVFGSDFKVFAAGTSVVDDMEAVQLGFTFEWKHFALDLSHGVKQVHWRVPNEPQWEMDEWQSGSSVTGRIYPFDTQTLRPLLIWSHSSDITRGNPFNNKEEPTSDFVGAGVTYSWNTLDLDVAYGLQARECPVFDCPETNRSETFYVRFRVNFFGDN